MRILYLANINLTGGTSIFDPVLCEIVYQWFCPQGGHVLDLFAGGSVRGIVATELGMQYTGIELNENQLQANEIQAAEICKDRRPVWVKGDALNILDLTGRYKVDLIFTCPPYYNLEVYSTDKNDLSTMEWPQFVANYKKIITDCVLLLKPDRFACFVVGDIRDENGIYRNFPGLTIEGFKEAGIELYNDAILITSVGSLPVRINKQFSSGRKMGKTHQNVLIFYKGDPSNIRKCFPNEINHIKFN